MVIFWVPVLPLASVAVTVLVPAVAVAGMVNVTGVVALPLASVETLDGLVVSAVPSNLKPEIVELGANPCATADTVVPGLLGDPTCPCPGVIANPPLTVKVAWLTTPRSCSSSPTSGSEPLGTSGTTQPLVAWVPEILPLEVAVSTHATSVSKDVLPSCTNTVAPFGHPEPVTVSPVPGDPEVGVTVALAR